MRKVLQNIGLVSLAFVLLIGLRQVYFLFDQDLDLSAATLEVERLQKENKGLSEQVQQLEQKNREDHVETVNEYSRKYTGLVYDILGKMKDEYIANFGNPPQLDTSNWEKFEDEEYSVRMPPDYIETESEEKTNTAGIYSQEFELVDRYWSYGGEEGYLLFVETYPRLDMPPEEYAMLGGGEYPPSPLKTTTLHGKSVFIDVDMVDGRRDSIWLSGNKDGEWYVLQMYYTRTEGWQETYLEEQEIFKAFVYSFAEK